MKANSWFKLFLLIVLVLLFGQFFLFRQLWIYNINLRSHLYDNGWWAEDKAKIVFLGSSNVMNDVIPNKIVELNQLKEGDVLNFGMNGATPFECWVTLSKYVERFPFPERVYFTLAPLLLYEGMYIKKDYEKILLTYQQWRKLEAEGMNNNYYFPINIFLESYKWDQQHNFKNYHFQLQQTRSNFGFQANFENPYSKEITARFIPRIDDAFGLSEFQMRYISKIKEMCEIHGAKFYLLLAPIHPILYKKYEEHPEYFQPVCDWMSKNLGKVSILGSMDANKYRLKDSDFINLDHLTIGGARKYTETEFRNIDSHDRIEKKKLVTLFKP